MLVEADLWGRNSHGTMRLAKWAPGIEEGTIAKRNEMKLIRRSGSIEWFEGNMTLGPVSAMTAIELCLKRAKESGVAICCVSGASHIGMLGYYAQKAALKGQIGIIMCNTEPAMAPYGGLDKVIGTNPIAVGIPSGVNPPIVLDMATTVHARGRVVEALEEGEELPAGWAEDAFGEPTIDPAKALEGSLLPDRGRKRIRPGNNSGHTLRRPLRKLGRHRRARLSRYEQAFLKRGLLHDNRPGPYSRPFSV